ncbi:tRNA methyltransferase, has a role in tRNA modification [Marasmius crinis-equi]|uniref:tRNA methyltransferase, has a role in tRNA modification n=1 Tax=Marasmius crinis-equi TaxID=585013 RepID=A0ABR3FXS7_9AGAR
MKNVTVTSPSGNPQEYEETHVHAVYEQIASHFSSTRYKPWPIIAKFLSDIPSGWVGFDSGTGNGKYLPLPLESPGRIWTIGMDRSRNLLDIARTAGGDGTIREVVCGDVLHNPWRKHVFDYAISIATIHHLATPARRRNAVQRLLQVVSGLHGRILIYVWATEQDELSKREIPNPESTSGSDVFVPWVMAGKPEAEQHVLNRYYHMFAEGELIALVTEAAQQMGLHVGPRKEGNPETRGVEVVQSGWERSNHYVELRLWDMRSEIE